MRLNKMQFSKIDGTKYFVWSYESAKKLYDIWQDKITKEFSYTINGLKSERTIYHNEIAAYYKIDIN